MIRRSLVIAVLVWLVSTPAWTQTVLVRSGEHPGYSRLVIDFTDRPAWRMGRTESGYALWIDPAGVRYDLSGVFRFIPRTRIAAVAQDAETGALQIRLACPCHADVFEHSTAALVIDIRDGPPPPGSRFETAAGPVRVEAPAEPARPLRPVVAAPWPASPPSTTAQGVLVGPRSAETVTLPNLPALAQPDPALTAPPITEAAASAPAARDIAGAIDSDAATTPDRDVRPITAQPIRPTAPTTETTPGLSDALRRQARSAAAAEALAQQLGRAAAQGLVQADVGDPDPAPPVPAQTESPAEIAAEESGPVATGRGNLRVRTSIDRDLSGLAPGIDGLLSLGPCIAPSRIDVASWGDDTRLGREIGRYRGALAAEFDRPTADAVTALARHYIYLSFGVEAAALLESYPGLAEDAPLIRTLAQLVDGRSPSTPGPLSGQAGCGGPVALWAMLADPEFGLEAPPEDILATFSALPLHLRRAVGPALSERFLQHGSTANATAVVRAIDRAPGDHGGAVALAEARLESATGQSDPEGAFTPLLDGDTDIAAVAALELLQDALADDGAIAAELIDTAATLAFELRSTAMGPALKQAEVRARSRNGDHAGALSALDAALRDYALPEEEARALAAATYLAAAPSATPVEAVRLAYDAPAVLGDDATVQPARRALADRLFDLGLPDMARDLVAPAAGSGPAAPDDRLRLAEAALAVGNPRLASAHLAGLGGPEIGPAIAPLRADMLSQNGAHGRAAEIFAANGVVERGFQEAVRSGNWAQVATLAPTPVDAFAARLANDSTASDGTAPAPDLLEAAGDLRAGVSALLEATQLPR